MIFDLRARFALLHEAARTNLWPTPVAAAVAGVIGGVALTRLDRRLDGGLSPTLSSYVFDGGPDAARSVLVAISGSLITVTSLTFSLTVVTLQLASSQFSPRLLRTFARDRFVQLTLALFLATFAYSLTVLRVVRTDSEDQDGFVPQLSVTVAYLLTLASVIALVLFLAHLAREIRVETMLRRVHVEAAATTRRAAPLRDHDRGDQDRDRNGDRNGDRGATLPVPPPDALTLVARGSGFVSYVDEAELVNALSGHGVLARIDVEPGALLVRGTPIGAIWRAGPADAAEGGDAPALAELARGAAHAVHTEYERTSAQDVAFGLRQLVDVAVKALSPGINDPTTAVHAVGHLAGLLCDLAERDLGPRAVRDDEGQTCAWLARADFAELLDLAVSGPLRYGAADRDLVAAVYRLLWSIPWATADEDVRAAVEERLRRVDRTVADQAYDDADRELLNALSSRVDAALHARPTRDPLAE